MLIVNTKKSHGEDNRLEIETFKNIVSRFSRVWSDYVLKSNGETAFALMQIPSKTAKHRQRRSGKSVFLHIYFVIVSVSYKADKENRASGPPLQTTRVPLLGSISTDKGPAWSKGMRLFLHAK